MKISLSLFIILFLVSPVNAQISDNMLIGVKTGLNYANYWGPDYNGTYSRVGWLIGGSFRFSLNQNLFLQSEVYYSTKGASLDVRNENVSLTFSEKLNYIEFPFILQYYFNVGESAPVKPFLLAGPYFAVLVNSTIQLEYSNLTEKADLENIESFDSGILFGAGMFFQKDKKGLYLELRYGLGLLKIYDESENANVHNGVFSLVLGYVI